MKYRKKPVVIEAVQLPDADHEANDGVIMFLHDIDCDWDYDQDGSVYIHTLEGVMRASPLDFIIKGVNGEYYPCKPEIFEKTYEPVNKESES